MAFSLLRRWWRFGSPPGAPPLVQPRLRGLRSDAALEAIAEAISNRTPNVALYNYPSLSGAFSALFAHLFHFRMGLPCLFLPFSSVVPFRIDDLCFEGLKKCYFLDFIGAQGFAAELSRRTCCEALCFDHRKSSVAKILSPKEGVGRLTFYFDDEKSSSVAAYEYFLSKDGANSLLNDEDRDRVELILKYLEDGDLRQRRLPDIWAFNIGVGEWRSKMNCITNPHMFDQLLALSAEEMIAKGKAYMSSRMDTAKGLLKKVFKLRLGRGFYGECLGVRADSNPDLSDEIAKELSLRSAASGLRPIGAVIYMQRNNLKMCLRSTDTATDTSEIAKAYGGGGSPSSSSFIIRMDEYNRWLSM